MLLTYWFPFLVYTHIKHNSGLYWPGLFLYILMEILSYYFHSRCIFCSLFDRGYVLASIKSNNWISSSEMLLFYLPLNYANMSILKSHKLDWLDIQLEWEELFNETCTSLSFIKFVKKLTYFSYYFQWLIDSGVFSGKVAIVIVILK